MMLARLLLAAAGLGAAFVVGFFAVALAGGGHGWGAPLLHSLLLAVAYPYVFVRTIERGRIWVWTDLLALALGIAADVHLVWATWRYEAEYFARAFDFFPFYPLLWILAWLAWQAVTAARIWRDVAQL